MYKNKKFVHHLHSGGNMNKTQSKQKNNTLISYIYAAIISLLVVACAVVIAVVNAKSVNTGANVGEDNSVIVSSLTSESPRI